MSFNFDTLKVISNLYLHEITTDKLIKNLISRSLPISFLRTPLTQGNKDLIDLYCIQNPIICYFHRDKYFLISGYFTYIKLSNLYTEINNVTIFCLPVKPQNKVCVTTFLSDITNCLLNQCLINEASQVKILLESLFTKDENKKSIYSSEQWQKLFPQVTTKSELAQWLKISKKMI